MTAQHPDEFILSLIKPEQEKFLETIERHRQTLQRPQKTREEYLVTLEKQGLSNTVAMIRQSGWIES